MPCKGKNVVLVGCIGIPSVLSIAFLALYLDTKYSDPAAQLKTCRSELQNQSSWAKEGLAALQRRLEAHVEAEKAATAAVEGLLTRLAAAEQSLARATKQRETCRNQLETLAQNLTAEVGDTRQREAEKCQAETDELQRQLSSQAQKLEESQHKNQQERADCEARIRRLQAETGRRSSAPGPVKNPSALVAAFLAFAFLFLP